MPVLGEFSVNFEDLYVWNEEKEDMTWANGAYCFEISSLIEKFPHLKECRTMEAYLLEIKNESGKVIKVFKPPKKLQFLFGRTWSYSNYYLVLPKEISDKFGIGKDYRITVLLMKHDGKVLLPFEIKQIGYYSTEEVYANIIKDIKEVIDLLSIEQSELQSAVKYTFDSYLRLQEGDVEGARTSLRKSLEALKDFLKIIKVVKTEKAIEEESMEFPSKMRSLISRIQDLLQYGGAHLGPAPKTTTQMIFHMTVDILKGLAKLIDNGVIILQNEERNREGVEK
ncbi:MAG: hypothetical protein J7J22_05780 [Candidatus Verstraetearchaeota archaeon]|nr:hypothetical protein [Candidatus Verstraetearchaeota archaeon]